MSSLLWIITIVVLLGILAYPQARAASVKGRIPTAVDRLRKLHQALLIYQESIGPVPESGTAAEMHIPPLTVFFQNALDLPAETYACPCTAGRKVEGIWATENFNYWNDDNPKRIFTRDSIILSSLGCNDDLLSIGAPFVQHRGIGIRLNGEIVDVLKKGNVADPDWWEGEGQENHAH